MAEPLDWSAWGAPLTEHVTLPSTGRPAVLHSRLRMGDVIRAGQWTDAIVDFLAAQVGQGTIDPVRAHEAREVVACATFVRPRLARTQAAADAANAALEPPLSGPQDERLTVPISVLEDSEIDDAMRLVLGGREFFEAFRDGAADAARSGTADGSAPEPAAARRAARRAGGPRRARPAA